jgi:hypothetical protein
MSILEIEVQARNKHILRGLKMWECRHFEGVMTSPELEEPIAKRELQNIA